MMTMTTIMIPPKPIMMAMTTIMIVVMTDMMATQIASLGSTQSLVSYGLSGRRALLDYGVRQVVLPMQLQATHTFYPRQYPDSLSHPQPRP